MPHKKLGEGAYGQVTRKNGSAVKKFSKLSHLIQEYIAGFYLKNVDNIVQVESVSVFRLETTMKLYDYTLKDWLFENSFNFPNEKVRFKVFRDILYGLKMIHGRHLAHGDLKPSNILIKEITFDVNTSKGIVQETDYQASIADLGFVSISRYAKVERTAPSYRDTVPMKGMAHDIYSLGLVLAEIFGNFKFRKQSSYSTICKQCDKSILNTKVRDLVKKMVDPERKDRPTVDDIFKQLYNQSVEVKLREMPQIPEKDSFMQIYRLVRAKAKEKKIQRARRGFDGLIMHLKNRFVSEDKYDLYAYCLLIILAAVFGNSSYQQDNLERQIYNESITPYEPVTYNETIVRLETGYRRKDLLGPIRELITDELFVTELLLP